MAREVGYMVPKPVTSTTGSMGPPPPRLVKRRREQEVLDEDEWTDKLEAIIQRDFFPDIPKLQNKLEWMEAVKSRDPEAIRRAQQNIAMRRAGMKTPIGATPRNFSTPGTSVLRTGGLGATPTPLHHAGATPTPSRQWGGPAGPQNPDPQPPSDTPLETLDQFCRKYTSEDNAAYQEIVVSSQERLEKTKPWLFEDKNRPLALENGPSGAERETDGFGTSGQPGSALITWQHTNKSRLYYDSSQWAAVPYTQTELSEQVQGPPKKTVLRNTRFASADAPAPEPEAGAGAPGGAGLVGPGGFSYVATPRFVPGVGASPLVTWGDIEGTPMRLEEDDGMDIPLEKGGGTGPAFRVPETSKREQLARDMASRKPPASLSRKPAGLLRTPLLGRTPGTPFSPAGRRLVSTKRAKLGGGGFGENAQLRASYAGTPSGRRGGTPAATASRLTSQTPVARAAAQTPKMEQPRAEPLPRAAPVAAKAAVPAKDKAVPAKGKASRPAAADFFDPAGNAEADLTDDLLIMID